MKKAISLLLCILLFLSSSVIVINASDIDYSYYDWDYDEHSYGRKLKYVNSSDGNWIYAVLADGTIAIKMGNAMYEKLKEPDGTKITEDRFVDVVVPETIDGYEVSVIGCNAFWVARLMRSIVLPKSVRRISTTAFWNCDFLTEVTLNEGLESIAERAFWYCTRLTEITMPKSLKSIDDGAFSCCDKISKVTIYEGVSRMGSNMGLNKATIYGFTGSYAEEYAIANEINFVSIGKAHCDHLNCYNITTGSCTEDGYITTICNDCGETVNTVENKAKGHIDGERIITKQPTTEEPGEITVYCKECGDIIRIEEIPVLPSHYKGFKDVFENDWYYDVVNYVAEKGYIKGYQNEMFGPNDALKRQDFVCILARIDGADLKAYENVQSKLTDVKKGDYYAAAVNWAVDNGYISGYKNGKFGVNDPITREQVATILYNYMNKPEVKDAEKILSKFPDANKVSSFAKTPIAWAVSNGVISGMGNGTVASTSGATRAQIAAIIQRMDTQGMFSK